MADAPEPAFSADERFPKYTIVSTDEDQTSPAPSIRRKPALPSEKPPASTPPPSSSQPLPSLVTVSPWNAVSPPQYAVDTPATERNPASPSESYPVYMAAERRDTAKSLKVPRLVEEVEEEKWRVGLCDCSAEGNGRLWCDALGCPCVMAGITHARMKGVRASYWNGYVREHIFHLLYSRRFLPRSLGVSFGGLRSSLLTYWRIVSCVCFSGDNYVRPVDSDDDRPAGH